MTNLNRAWAFAALFAALSISSSASAGSSWGAGSGESITIVTVIEVGNNVNPVNIDENSQINIARVIEIGGTGPVDATIVQNGIDNYASVFQVGSSTNSVIEQFGVNNTSSVTQGGNNNNAGLLQVGTMNSGSTRQFGGQTQSAQSQSIVPVLRSGH
jgi:minor curlin subunit